MKYWDFRAQFDRWVWRMPILSRISRAEYASALTLLGNDAQSPDAILLHLACGVKGAVWHEFTGRVIQLDRSRRMLEFARRESETGLFLCGDALQLPIRDATVSAIVAIGLTEYLPDPEAWLQEMARVLASSGILVFSGSQPNFANRMRRIWNRNKIHLRTEAEWRNFCESEGFVIEQVRTLPLQLQFRCHLQG